MAGPSNTMTLIKAAQAARVKTHIRAMVSRLLARTRKVKNQTANFAELPVMERIRRHGLRAAKPPGGSVCALPS